MDAPKAPPQAPTIKPIRRPRLCINALSHGAVIIEPNTMSEMGNVAKHGLVESMFPAKPPTTNIIGIWQPRVA